MKQKLNNSMEINQKNKSYVGADDSVCSITKKNTQRGITLVALVVTIIVLLILAMVSIKIAMDGGLITKSSGATKQHTIAAEKEAIQLGYSEYKIDLANNKPASLTVKDAITEQTAEGWKVTFSGTTGNVYTINSKGEIAGPTKEEKTEDDIAMEKYVLGEELKGQALSQIASENNGKIQLKELNNETVTFLGEGADEENNIEHFAIYLKYKNKAYKVSVDSCGGSTLEEFTSKKVKFVYEPKGREGQKVKYSYDGKKENEKEWTILYDYGNSVEIISPDEMGELTLGSENNLENAVNSYNNAISTINEYASSFITNNNKETVRSVGNNTNDTVLDEKYSFDGSEIWSGRYNGKLYSFDELNIRKPRNSFEQDLIRIGFFETQSIQRAYWCSSTIISQDEDSFSLEVLVTYINDEGTGGCEILTARDCSNESISDADSIHCSGSNTYAVRPIVKISYPQN